MHFLEWTPTSRSKNSQELLTRSTGRPLGLWEDPYANRYPQVYQEHAESTCTRPVPANSTHPKSSSWP